MTGRRAVGVVLAAGAGSRFGKAKGLVRADDGVPWVQLACRALVDGGCAEVVVVLGAQAEEAEEAEALVPARATVVVAAEWASGISASLRTGLAAAGETEADAVVVSLVDLPGLRAAAVRRVLDRAEDPLRRALARATYGGKPGHPVLIGRAHWSTLAAVVHGDTGAGPYLRAHGAAAVDCTDLGGGDDVDHRIDHRTDHR
ncbi:NTP transferase domain-containing protein [Promicromonospora sp. Populi]|uniref:nucleotidyltransferase family protein n=1 Tax=Promicromonospora sp. Populi TaxID=3239420 RepID=UPI0034E28A94